MAHCAEPIGADCLPGAPEPGYPVFSYRDRAPRVRYL